MSENNNRKMKPSGMKMEEDALFSRSFERGAQAEPDSLVRISLQTGAPQPNVSSEGRKCVNNICSRVQIQMEPVAFTWLQCSRWDFRESVDFKVSTKPTLAPKCGASNCELMIRVQYFQPDICWLVFWFFFFPLKVGDPSDSYDVDAETMTDPPPSLTPGIKNTVGWAGWGGCFFVLFCFFFLFLALTNTSRSKKI